MNCAENLCSLLREPVARLQQRSTAFTTRVTAPQEDTYVGDSVTYPWPTRIREWHPDRGSGGVCNGVLWQTCDNRVLLWDIATNVAIEATETSHLIAAVAVSTPAGGSRTVVLGTTRTVEALAVDTETAKVQWLCSTPTPSAVVKFSPCGRFVLFANGAMAAVNTTGTEVLLHVGQPWADYFRGMIRTGPAAMDLCLSSETLGWSVDESKLSAWQLSPYPPTVVATVALAARKSGPVGLLRRGASAVDVIYGDGVREQCVLDHGAIASVALLGLPMTHVTHVSSAEDAALVVDAASNKQALLVWRPPVHAIVSAPAEEAVSVGVAPGRCIGVGLHTYVDNGVARTTFVFATVESVTFIPLLTRSQAVAKLLRNPTRGRPFLASLPATAETAECLFLALADVDETERRAALAAGDSFLSTLMAPAANGTLSPAAIGSVAALASGVGVPMTMPIGRVVYVDAALWDVTLHRVCALRSVFRECIEARGWVSAALGELQGATWDRHTIRGCANANEAQSVFYRVLLRGVECTHMVLQLLEQARRHDVALPPGLANVTLAALFAADVDSHIVALARSLLRHNADTAAALQPLFSQLPLYIGVEGTVWFRVWEGQPDVAMTVAMDAANVLFEFGALETVAAALGPRREVLLRLLVAAIAKLTDPGQRYAAVSRLIAVLEEDEASIPDLMAAVVWPALQEQPALQEVHHDVLRWLEARAEAESNMTFARIFAAAATPCVLQHLALPTICAAAYYQAQGDQAKACACFEAVAVADGVSMTRRLCCVTEAQRCGGSKALHHHVQVQAGLIAVIEDSPDSSEAVEAHLEAMSRQLLSRPTLYQLSQRYRELGTGALEVELLATEPAAEEHCWVDAIDAAVASSSSPIVGCAGILRCAVDHETSHFPFYYVVSLLEAQGLSPSAKLECFAQAGVPHEQLFEAYIAVLEDGRLRLSPSFEHHPIGILHSMASLVTLLPDSVAPDARRRYRQAVVARLQRLRAAVVQGLHSVLPEERELLDRSEQLCHGIEEDDGAVDSALCGQRSFLF